MLQEEEYDSDTSDEDFVPEGVESEDEALSEEEDAGSEENDNEGTKATGNVKKKKTGKTKKKNPLLSKLNDNEADTPSNKEENAAVDEEKEKAKAEDLWADFLADVDDKPAAPQKPKSSSWASLLGNKKSTTSTKPTTATKPSAAASKKEEEEEESSPQTVKITKVFEFAGEEVRVEKEVDANSSEAKLALVSPTKGNSQERSTGTKRPGGLSNIMGLLENKKPKLSTLEKTKLDWSNFKSEEGIDEELESHKKSKHGYLDKQAFLERADVRQFEIERSLRMSKRSNR
ncbi:Craniofacial development protein 1 [Halocaridina rubra]|uniref:Craniofacial development protein 1 n=1 Tax=Halocaridina rubra TaxID=373956 RepID=A0AAN8ZZW1_HALRR